MQILRSTSRRSFLTRALQVMSLPVVAVVVKACGGSSNGGSPDPTGPETGTVEGRVLSGDNQGVQGTQISMTRTGAGSLTATTGNDGRFSFSDVSTGSWSLTFTPPAGFEAAAGQDSTVTVNVTAGGTANVTLQLRPTEVEGGDREITLGATSFSPNDLTIPAGTRVTWRNAGAIIHTITPDGHGEWTRVEMETAGQTFSHRFETPGTFEYFCEPHRSIGMTGVIRVQ
ncbi:MAG: plastocyanin/azurin family copper-binding protein [Gemmatimonadota bacterium]